MELTRLTCASSAVLVFAGVYWPVPKPISVMVTGPVPVFWALMISARPASVMVMGSAITGPHCIAGGGR